MKRIFLIVAITGFILIAGYTNQKTMPQTKIQTGQHAVSMSRPVTMEINYWLYLPKDYAKENKRWPLMIFLHGLGERGPDINKVKVHGPPKLIEQGRQFPFIIVSPQCPEGSWWPYETSKVLALIDEISETYRVDKNRIYLTGLSMGGFGTWAVAGAYPDRFAAIAPICGGGYPFLAPNMKDLPIWAFHGAKDSVVPLRRSQEMVDAVNRAGGDAKLTVYPEAGHDSWTEAYNNDKLYEWLLSHSRKQD